MAGPVVTARGRTGRLRRLVDQKLRNREDPPQTWDSKYASHGRINYEVPPNGFLDVRDASHFRLTKSNIVVTRSGRVFPELPWAAAPPFDHRIGFSTVTVTSDGWYWFLMGTERELYEYFNGREEVVGGVKDQCVQEDKAGVIS